MKRELLHTGLLFLPSSLCVAALLAVSLYSPLIMGEDPYALLRYIVIRMTAIFIAMPFLAAMMVAIDFVTPGDWMKAIGNDPKACSYVMASVVLVIGGILCWT
jgi:hypothetical protein